MAKSPAAVFKNKTTIPTAKPVPTISLSSCKQIPSQSTNVVEKPRELTHLHPRPSRSHSLLAGSGPGIRAPAPHPPPLPIGRQAWVPGPGNQWGSFPARARLEPAWDHSLTKARLQWITVAWAAT